MLAFSVSAENTFPKGCRAMVIHGEEITITAKSNRLIYIHNISSNNMWLTHPKKDPGASAGWTTRLQAGNWSALTIEKGPFILNCIESKPGHEQQIPCMSVVAVCKWKKMPAPKNDDVQTYWVAEDMSLPALNAAVDGRGFNVSASEEE